MGFARRPPLSVFVGFGFAKPRTSDRWDMRTWVDVRTKALHRLAAEWLLRLFFRRLLWPTHGLDLALGPRPHLLDQSEGCGPVEGRRLVPLVA